MKYARTDLDTSVLVAAERLGETVSTLLQRIRTQTGSRAFAISTVSVVELAHGCARAKSDSSRRWRDEFFSDVLSEVESIPLGAEVATAAGRIEEDLASRGTKIGFEDLVRGVTALHLGYAVVTVNVRHSS